MINTILEHVLLAHNIGYLYPFEREKLLGHFFVLWGIIVLVHGFVVFGGRFRWDYILCACLINMCHYSKVVKLQILLGYALKEFPIWYLDPCWSSWRGHITIRIILFIIVILALILSDFISRRIPVFVSIFLKRLMIVRIFIDNRGSFIRNLVSPLYQA